MSNLPSASKLGLAFTCAASAVYPETREVGEASEEGNALHTGLAQVTLGATPEEAEAAVQEAHRAAFRAIDFEALPRFNAPWLLTHRAAEVAFAIEPRGRKARVLGSLLSREEAYSQRQEGEFVGTADRVGVLTSGPHAGMWAVVDWKTGYAGTAAPASENWQLRFLALAVHLLTGAEEVAVAIVRTRGSVRCDWHVLGLMDFDAALEELVGLQEKLKTLAHVYEEKGIMLKWGHVEGAHCSKCPAFDSCKRKTALVRRLSSDSDALVSDVTRLALTDVQAAYAVFQDVKKVSQKLGAFFAGYVEGGRSIPVAPGEAFAEWKGEKLEVDGLAALEVLTALHGVEVARNAVDVRASKSAIEAAIAAVAPKGKKAALVREAMAAIEAQGGVTRRPTSTKEVRKVKADNDVVEAA